MCPTTGIQTGCSFVYLDDVIFVTSDFETHLNALKEHFIRLNDMGLVFNKEKCEFMKYELKYLSFVVDKRGLHPHPDKIIKSIMDFSTQKNS